MKITICNLRTNKPIKPWDVKVDRSSPLGNPFYMSDESKRNEVCDKYEEHFDNMKKIEGIFLEELRRIGKLGIQYGKLNLFCWCYPKRCHAETIKKYLEENY